jgi:polysaccharide export outer membrane protein
VRIHLFTFALALGCAVPPVASAQATTDATAAGRQLRPGDVVRLRIWREPDMSGEFTVDETGLVVFPRVGEYSVLSDTPESLSRRLQADYRTYLVNPSIEVTVLRRVRIMGAVNHPGLFPVDPTITVGDALALAGGATSFGDPDKLEIFRNGQRIDVDVSQDTRVADSPIQSGDQLWVPERSWFARNTGIVAAAITGAVTLIAVLLR